MNVLKALKEICNKIVGGWYCEETKELFIFDLNDTLLRESKVRIIKGEDATETIYGVAVRTDFPNPRPQFYFDIGMVNKRYYNIVSLTKELLVINEFFMIPDTPPSPHVRVLKRLSDSSSADDILKALDLE